ncbi:MAG TPA: hypothetical protein VGM92_04010 [Candidatus Kapabacteria bacterium]|jgi:hypothetical protein
MSKGGGAGKVYFILYLAVLLELLIIIVERDDAEEALRKEKEELLRKTKRIQLIAETIINSLRGSPTAVSSTSDQSMVLGDKNEVNGREFNVRIRLADPAHDTVKDLDLHILRNNSEMAVINIAADSVMYPRMKDSASNNDIIFKYNFKPQFGAGEYKLHFDAKTNQIVGVTQTASPDDTVKIGAVHLTVKELKEVKDGIQENISLRGYIDSLLNGGYENFAANIGSNEFTVNVKPPQEVDQLKIFPQEANFASFPALDLPNGIKIEGATISGPQGVHVSVVDGPGQIIPAPADSGFCWTWKPEAKDAGQTYTIKLAGKANRNGMEKDQATTTFTVSVDKLEPATPSHFFPENAKTHDGTPYTNVPFKANEKFANLDGTYRTELYINGAKVATAEEPTVEYTPEFMKDEGKSLEVKAFYKSNTMKDFVQIDDQTFKIGPPPLLAVSEGDPNAGDPLDVKAALSLAQAGKYQEIGSDHLDIESEGYFETKATKLPGTAGARFEFEARMTSKGQGVKAKAGQTVNITITDPTTGQSKTFAVQIMPKVQQQRGYGGYRGGGSGGGGGGIH